MIGRLLAYGRYFLLISLCDRIVICSRVASRIPKERWSHENSLTHTILSTVLVVGYRLFVGSVDLHDESNCGKRRVF